MFSSLWCLKPKKHYRGDFMSVVTLGNLIDQFLSTKRLQNTALYKGVILNSVFIMNHAHIRTSIECYMPGMNKLFTEIRRVE